MGSSRRIMSLSWGTPYVYTCAFRVEEHMHTHNDLQQHKPSTHIVTTPAMTLTWANDREDFGGMLEAPDSYEFLFG
jgi:hypothetical protein